MRDTMRHGHDIQSVKLTGMGGINIPSLLWIAVIIAALVFCNVIAGDIQYQIEKWNMKEDLTILNCTLEESKTRYTLYIQLRNEGSKSAEGIPDRIETDTNVVLNRDKLQPHNRFRSLASGINLEPMGIPARGDGVIAIQIAKTTLQGARELTIYYDTLEAQKITVPLM